MKVPYYSKCLVDHLMQDASLPKDVTDAYDWLCHTHIKQHLPEITNAIDATCGNVGTHFFGQWFTASRKSLCFFLICKTSH
ncbi:MAG: hypothetical protein R3A11_02245 [Bdellovibrionota bacterium]